MQFRFSIARWWQSKGFGIESKTDYEFLHDVLKEAMPYYAYEDLRQRYPRTTQSELKQARLFFRIANNIKPKEIRIAGQVSELNKAHFGAAPKGNDGILLFIGENAVVQHFHGYKAIVVTNIDEGNADIWNRLEQANAITYDMYNVGIALFYDKRTAEHYKI